MQIILAKEVSRAYMWWHYTGIIILKTTSGKELNWKMGTWLWVTDYLRGWFLRFQVVNGVLNSRRQDWWFDEVCDKCDEEEEEKEDHSMGYLGGGFNGFNHSLSEFFTLKNAIKFNSTPISKPLLESLFWLRPLIIWVIMKKKKLWQVAKESNRAIGSQQNSQIPSFLTAQISDN